MIPSLFALLMLMGPSNNANKPVLYVPLPQTEYAYNLIRECPTVDVTWISEKATFVVSWDYSGSRYHWVLYMPDGKVIDTGETIKVSSAARDICKAATK
jgi:hypothetical protein